MHLSSEYFVFPTMSYTVTFGNDHVHVMGNRNVKSIGNEVVRISDEVHDSNDDIEDILKSKRETRQVHDSVIQPNIFPTQFPSTADIQNQCKVTFENSIATSVIVSSCSNDMQDMHVSTMRNQPQSGDNKWVASATLNLLGVTSAIDDTKKALLATPEKLASLRSSLPAPKSCTKNCVASHSSVDALVPRIVYTPEHIDCLRQMEASSIGSVKLRDNVVGQCYAIGNSSSESSDSCRKTVNSCASLSDSALWCKDDDKNFTVGKKYKVTKEDGNVVEGVFDGKYIVVADQSCTKSKFVQVFMLIELTSPAV